MMEDSKIIELYWLRDESAIHATSQKYGAYLFKIAYNILADSQDSEESVNDTYLKAWNSMPPHRPDLLAEAIGAYLRSLTPEARNIFVGRYFYLDSIRETAAYYGISESKVKSLLHRTRKDLKAYLEKEGFLL